MLIEHCHEFVSLVSSCYFMHFAISFSAEVFTDGGKGVALGDFSEIWKLQRKIAFGAIRLVSENIFTDG